MKKIILSALMVFTSLMPVNAAHTSEMARLVAMGKFSPVDSSDYDKVVRQIRRQLKERAKQIVFEFNCTKEVTDGDIRGLVDAALEHTGVPDEGDYLAGDVLMNYKFTRHYPNATNKLKGTVTINNLNYVTTLEQEKYVTRSVSQFVSLLDDGLTDLEKIKEIHEYIVEGVEYDYNNDGQILKNSAYGALINDKAQCVGYANLFYRLCLEVGIDCRRVTGNANGDHSWNIVKLGDKYYHIDVSWDDTTRSNDYYLMGTKDISNHELYEEYTTGEFAKKYPISDYRYTVYGDNEKSTIQFGFLRINNKDYWFENWTRQGVIGDPKNIFDTIYGYERGREIYDPNTEAWYWLDAIYDGAKASNKEVWMPYLYQEDLLTGANPEGKWVRYDENGKMIKGWYEVTGDRADLYRDQAGNKYYYDYMTGAMLKGEWIVEGVYHRFDESTGKLIE